MNEPISLKKAPHYLWGNQCDGWWLKEEGSFTVVSEMMPPGTAEKKHLHKVTDQFFYCLEGSLTIDYQDQTHTIPQSSGLAILPGNPHKVYNKSTENVRFLVISGPNAHEDRVDLE